MFSIRRTVFAALAAAALSAGCQKAPPEPAPNAATPQPQKGFTVVDGKLVEVKPADPNAKTAGPAPTLLPTPVKDFIQYTEFVGGPNGVVAYIASGDRGNWNTVYVCRAATGEEVGRVRASDAAARWYSASPDGKTLLMVTSNGLFGSEQATLFDVASGEKGKSFKPTPSDKSGRGVVGLTRTVFVSPDRLLAVTSTSGFDVWDVTAEKQLFGVAGPLPNGVKHTALDRSPGFAITPDAKTFALFDGRGYAFYDPATGKKTGETERLDFAGEVVVWGTAFRADGARLASATREGTPPADVVRVWDAATGKKVSEFRPTVADPFRATLGWCGPDHLRVGGSSGHETELWPAAGPKAVGKLVTPVRPNPPDDNLWTLVRPQGKTADNFQLLKIGPPPFGQSPAFWLGMKGYSTVPTLD